MFSPYSMSLALAVLLAYQLCANCSPVTTETSATTESNGQSGNDTVPEDLYVIKSVVYEIGVLTDATNDTDANSTESQEQADIIRPGVNGASIDLSNLAKPIQINVSSITNTEIVPGARLAAALFNLLQPRPNSNNTINNFSSSSSSSSSILPAGLEAIVVQNISTTDPRHGEEIIDNLPKLLGLKAFRNDEDSSEEDSQSSQESNSQSEETNSG